MTCGQYRTFLSLQKVLLDRTVLDPLTAFEWISSLHAGLTVGPPSPVNYFQYHLFKESIFLSDFFFFLIARGTGGEKEKNSTPYSVSLEILNWFVAWPTSFNILIFQI